MYEFFMDGIDFVRKLVQSMDVLMFIAIGLLAAVLVFDIILTIVFNVKKKKRKKCSCEAVQFNFVRRAIIFPLAWIFAAYAFVSHFGTGNIVNLNIYHFVLPVVFLLLVYLIDGFFCIFNRSKSCGCAGHGDGNADGEDDGECDCDESCECGCQDGESCTCGEKDKKQKRKEKKEKRVKEKNVRSEQTEQDEEPQIQEQARPKYVTSDDAENGRDYMTEYEYKSTSNYEYKPAETEQAAEPTYEQNSVPNASPKPSSMAVKAAPKKSLRMRADVRRSAKVKAKNKKSEKERAEERNERIVALGEKIERQRQMAIKETDEMPVSHDETAYAAQTQAALHNAEETASRMDELQRRIAALRAAKSQTVREVQTTEKVTRDEQVIKSVNQRNMTAAQKDGSVSVSGSAQGFVAQSNSRSVSVSGKTTNELLKEKEDLRQKYESLKNTLVQSKEESGARQSQSASIGYYNGDGSFERTGKSENLSKISSHNKYDEEEVQAALLGLKGAMDDLQKQIDDRDDRDNQ